MVPISMATSNDLFQCWLICRLLSWLMVLLDCRKYWFQAQGDLKKIKLLLLCDQESKSSTWFSLLPHPRVIIICSVVDRLTFYFNGDIKRKRLINLLMWTHCIYSAGWEAEQDDACLFLDKKEVINKSSAMLTRQSRTKHFYVTI